MATNDRYDVSWKDVLKLHCGNQVVAGSNHNTTGTDTKDVLCNHMLKVNM